MCLRNVNASYRRLGLNNGTGPISSTWIMPHHFGGSLRHYGKRYLVLRGLFLRGIYLL